MQVVFENHGWLGRVVLDNAPENRLSQTMLNDLCDMETFLSTPSLKAVVFCGKGEHFCAGFEHRVWQSATQTTAELNRLQDRIAEVFDSLRCAPVPLIAAIRGECAGIGLVLALACHFRVAAPDARLSLGEGREAAVWTGWVTRLVGAECRRMIVRMALAGKPLRGTEAVEIGLAERCSGDQPELEAERLAVELVGRRSPEVVRAAMSSIACALRLPREQALREETELFCRLACRSEMETTEGEQR